NPAQSRRPAVGVHIIVAEEFPAGSVELVAATLDGDVDHGSGAVAVLGRVAVTLYAELGHSVNRGQHHIDAIAAETGGVGSVVNAVEQIVVVQGTVSVDADRAA